MKYLQIKRHYEGTLKKHGANHKGMDWPNEQDLDKRFEVMMNLVTEGGRPSVLDLGCGVGLLLDYIRRERLMVEYIGVDISPKMIKIAQQRYPDYEFDDRDILKNPPPDRAFDYIVMNGVLTERVRLSKKDMKEFAKAIITAAFKACDKGIAFNVMNNHVDWHRKDLFYWSFDEMYAFVKTLSRHVVIRADYGLYEFTCYIYREAQ